MSTEITPPSAPELFKPTPKGFRRFFRARMFVLPVLALLLFILWLSPLSFFLWGPPLTALLKFFYFPYYVFPESWYVLRGFLPLPNIPLLGLVLVLSLAFAYLLGYFCEFLSIKYATRYRLIILSVLLSVAFTGGVIKQGSCVYLSKQDQFLSHIGLLNVVFHDDGLNGLFVSQDNLRWFSLFNGLKFQEGDPKTGRVLFTVRPGSEVSKTCRIQTYPQVAGISDGITESQLFARYNKNFWFYVDKEFCDTGLLTQHTVEECKSRLSNIVVPEKSASPGSEVSQSMATYRAESLAITYDSSRYYLEEKKSGGYISIYVYSKSNGYIMSIALYHVESELPVVLSVEDTYKARMNGDTTYNEFMTNIAKRSIAGTEFIYWEEIRGNQGTALYEALLPGNAVIDIVHNLGTFIAGDVQTIMMGLSFGK